LGDGEFQLGPTKEEGKLAGQVELITKFERALEFLLHGRRKLVIRFRKHEQTEKGELLKEARNLTPRNADFYEGSENDSWTKTVSKRMRKIRGPNIIYG